jgi:hypothetical protein
MPIRELDQLKDLLEMNTKSGGWWWIGSTAEVITYFTLKKECFPILEGCYTCCPWALYLLPMLSMSTIAGLVLLLFGNSVLGYLQYL